MSDADPFWRDRARCRGVDTALFFPVESAAKGPQPLHEAACRLCDGCTVIAECLGDAIETGEMEFGIRAGMTPAQRRIAVYGSRRRLA